jgi:hypothetical protein
VNHYTHINKMARAENSAPVIMYVYNMGESAMRPRVEHIVGRLYNARYDSHPANANTMRIFHGIRAAMVYKFSVADYIHSRYELHFMLMLTFDFLISRVKQKDEDRGFGDKVLRRRLAVNSCNLWSKRLK